MLFLFTVPVPWGPTHFSKPSPSGPVDALKSPKTGRVSCLGHGSTRLDRGVECVLHSEIICLSRSIYRNQGNDTQGVTNPPSHNMLIDRCYLNYHGSQFVEHGYSNSLGMETIRATRPLVCVTTCPDLTTIRSLNLRKCCNTDVQTLELK